MSQKASATMKSTRKKRTNVLSAFTLQLLDDEPLGCPPTKKFKPLSSAPKFNALTSDSSPSSQSSSRRKSKGKEKALGPVDLDDACLDDRLWLEMYEPTSEVDLAVHKRKVEDVRRWLMESFEGGPSGKLRKYRRLLVLSGPAGAAKTTTIRVLSKEIGFEILEWGNTISEPLAPGKDHEDYGQRFLDYEGTMDKFQAFAARAASCRSVFSVGTAALSHDGRPLSQSSHPSAASQSHSNSQSSYNQRDVPSKLQVILLEDLPNVTHGKTQDRFHSILDSLVQSEALIPVVIIVSDAGIRGETGDDVGLASGPSRKETINVRSVVPSTLLRSPYVTEIKFNPISVTLMRKALQSLVSKLFNKSHASRQPPKEVLELIIESAGGDVRSAIMALQFASAANTSKVDGKAKKRERQLPARGLIEVVSRREQSLAMFHLLGKILYNKRKGDPPPPSASAKDIQRDKEFDAALKDPPCLPSHLQEHQRRTSRVDVEVLYADSPIDASLLSLYVHQNYTQFCNELEEADGVSEWLSWIDSNGGDQWYQTNPNSFHLLTLGTLHSLPSPVPRRSQQIYKPEFFENLKACRETQDAVEDVMLWVNGVGQAGKEFEHGTQWKPSEIAMELGPILKLKSNLHPSGPSAPPPSHRLFSSLVFSRAAQGPKTQLSEDDVPLEASMSLDEDSINRLHSTTDETHTGGWLEDDDIED